MASILIVEDDKTLQEVLKYNLLKEGYNVLQAFDGESGLELARQKKPDLIVLDLMLPVMNGLEVCRIMRNESSIPVIILTAKAEEVDKVVGLEIGADDYVTKPFSMRELMARIKARLRQATQLKALSKSGISGETEMLVAGDLTVDLKRHIVSKGDRAVELGPKEYDLLVFLMNNVGQVFSREQILQKVWGYDYIGNARTVDVHIRWMRQKLEDNPEKPQYILTVRGYGYKFASM